EADLLSSIEEYRLNSTEGEITQENYLKINNTNLAADEVALMIKKQFEI
ncbi:MAG TPA: shikimate kinase, partial [Rummeliibacillus sp.]|nr:shikimate kinase [Rummeliibacillus sp.]